MALGYVAGVGGGNGGRRVPNISQAQEQIYNGQLQTAVWRNYNPDTVDIVSDPGPQKEAGTDYSVGFRPKTKFVWADTKTTEIRYFTWKISPCKISNPIITNGTFTFSGDTKIPTVSYDAKISTNGDNPEDIFAMTSGSGRDAKDYTMSWSIRSNNYAWTETAPTIKTAAWKINKLLLAKPTFVGTSSFPLTLNGTQYPSVKSVTVNTLNSDYWTVQGVTSGQYAKKYPIVFTLKEPNNVNWSDGSTNSHTIEWEITGITISPITYSKIEFTHFNPKQGVYDAQTKLASMINSQNSNLASVVTFSGTTVVNNPQFKNIKASNTQYIVGDYTIIVGFASNFNTDDHPNDIMWTGNLRTKDYQWSILPGTLCGNVPAQSSTSKVWDNTNTVLKNIFSTDITNTADYIDITVNNEEAFAGTDMKLAGTYTIKMTPTINFVWNDIKTTATKQYTYTIEKKTLTTPPTKSRSLTFDRLKHSISDFVSNNSTWQLSSGVQLTNYGNIQGLGASRVKDSFSESLKIDKAMAVNNCVWSESGTNAVVPISVTLTCAKVVKPSISPTSYTYNGGDIFFTPINLESNYVGIGHQNQLLGGKRVMRHAVLPGTYWGGFYLKTFTGSEAESSTDVQDRTWTDNTTAPVVLSWTITPDYKGRATAVLLDTLTMSLSSEGTGEDDVETIETDERVNTTYRRTIHVFFNNDSDAKTGNVSVEIANPNICSAKMAAYSSSTIHSVNTKKARVTIFFTPLAKGTTTVTISTASPSASNQQNTYSVPIKVIA